MKKQSRKRFFSFIFVPDQERDPKSISLNYVVGKLLVIIAILLTVHILLGAFGYYRIFWLEKNRRILTAENQDLKTRNKKIERIAKEFQEIRKTDEKIRKALGGSLGVGYESDEVQGVGGVSVSDVPAPIEVYGATSIAKEKEEKKIQNNLYFLSEKRSEFLAPDYLPTLLPVEGFLTTHYQKGGLFAGRNHYGIDIAAKKGSVIRAAGKGVVILSDWTPDFGNIVVISHGDGFFSYYGHAMRALVDQGFQVRKGQAIAFLGSSGISSAPHLHFEIWKDGEPLDPEQFIFTIQSRKEEAGF